MVTFFLFCFSGTGAGQGTIDNRIEQAMVSPLPAVKFHYRVDSVPGSSSVGSICFGPPGSASGSVSHKYGSGSGSGSFSFLISVEWTEKIMVAK